MDRRVIIVELKATWSAEYDAISTTIREALGPLALGIDHIGSTSVPGLPAKDVIDVQVTVAALDRERLARALARGLCRSEHRERPSPARRDRPG